MNNKDFKRIDIGLINLLKTAHALIELMNQGLEENNQDKISLAIQGAEAFDTLLGYMGVIQAARNSLIK